MSEKQTSNERVSSSESYLNAIDPICDRFEIFAWRRGESPRLESYLTQGHQPDLFRNLLEIEVEYLRVAERVVVTADLIDRFPEYAEIVRDICETSRLDRTGGDLESAEGFATSTQARSRQLGATSPLQTIGEGGFGTVYMAEQQKPVHRRVAR